MKELTIPVETIDDAELSAALTIIMDKNGKFYLNAPINNVALCEMLLGMARRTLDEGIKREKAEKRIIGATEQVLKDLAKK